MLGLYEAIKIGIDPAGIKELSKLVWPKEMAALYQTPGKGWGKTNLYQPHTIQKSTLDPNTRSV